ncbi:MAG: TetR/AcrR family transcriptional regulator C-terminal domain-containing protein [Novosphingobium sp.]
MDEAAAARRQVFVDAAREAFFANGYAGTTMSSIASTVGGSKTTLWTYFPSKEMLFAAVVDDIVEQYARVQDVDLRDTDDLRGVLLEFVRALMDTILSPPIIALHRLVLAEASRFPYLAEAFYERGPRRGKARLSEFVGRAMERGQLRAGDPMLATRQLAGMCQAGCFQSALFNLDEPSGQADLEFEMSEAVDSFLRAWSLQPRDAAPDLASS